MLISCALCRGEQILLKPRSTAERIIRYAILANGLLSFNG